MVVTERLASVLGWFGARRRNWKFADIIRNLSLSLSLVFSSFSLFASTLIDSGSRGLKAERGVAVVSHGVRETWRSPENSLVFRGLSFFFLFFPRSLHYLPLKRTFVLESLKILY